MTNRVEVFSDYQDDEPVPTYDAEGRIIWLPDHLDGQLPLPGYATFWKPTAEEIIRDDVRAGRIMLCVAVGELAFYAALSQPSR